MGIAKFLKEPGDKTVYTFQLQQNNKVLVYRKHIGRKYAQTVNIIFNTFILSKLISMSMFTFETRKAQ